MITRCCRSPWRKASYTLKETRSQSSPQANPACRLVPAPAPQHTPTHPWSNSRLIMDPPWQTMMPNLAPLLTSVTMPAKTRAPADDRTLLFQNEAAGTVTEVVARLPVRTTLLQNCECQARGLKGAITSQNDTAPKRSLPR